MNSNYAVMPLTLEDLEDLLGLHALYLNYGDGIRAHFAQALADPNTVAVKCVYQGQMIGLDLYVRGIYLSGGHPDLCAAVRAAAGDGVVYTGDALLVVPQHRHRGVDTAMASVCRNALAARGANWVLYELWVHPDGQIPAHRSVERYRRVTDLGFHPDFYKDFDHFGYYCPICGEKCKCAAHLYLCKIDGSGKDDLPCETQASAPE